MSSEERPSDTRQSDNRLEGEVIIRLSAEITQRAVGQEHSPLYAIAACRCHQGGGRRERRCRCEQVCGACEGRGSVMVLGRGGGAAGKPLQRDHRGAAAVAAGG